MKRLFRAGDRKKWAKQLITVAQPDLTKASPTTATRLTAAGMLRPGDPASSETTGGREAAEPYEIRLRKCPSEAKNSTEEAGLRRFELSL